MIFEKLIEGVFSKNSNSEQNKSNKSDEIHLITNSTCE